MVFKSKVSKSIDADSELILSTDYYQHKAIMIGIEAPYKALEAGNFKDGLTSVQLAAFLLEKLAWSNGVIEDDDQDLAVAVEKEKKKIMAENLSLDSDTAKTRISYAKIASILKKIEENKPTKTEYKV